MASTDLSVALRAWRDRTRPEEVGLPARARRRAPGLRREDLAALSGVSVDYVVRLEQGRASSPSAQILAALARALRLTNSERDLLYALAGVASPSAGIVPRHVGPGVQRIVDQLVNSPVSVYTASWDLLLANALWQTLFGERDQLSGRASNLVWRFFADGQSGVLGSEAENDHFAHTIVSDLRDAASRYPNDRELASMITDLLTVDERFARIWRAHNISRQISEHKTIRSPTIGPVTVECDILTAPGSDLRLVVYTARPGSEDADKLELLRVTGLAAFSPSRTAAPRP
jgi:transcriptional regulator with XRE-family HTH domain